MNDEQIRSFITNGFLILNADFPEAFHQRLTEQLGTIYAEEGNPGNNLLPRIREVQQLFDHPTITGALTSVLGQDYMLHAHRHGHYNAQPVPGGWHKDSYWGYSRMRNHHPWWAMIMYFPQDTPLELGPTGVMPGTQNYETRTFESDETEGEAYASGKAGTFALIHYDIWHRSTANVRGQSRYMLKFEFMRTQVPQAPSWNNAAATWTPPADLQLPIASHDAMWEDTWNWLSGRAGSLAGTRTPSISEIEELQEQLRDTFEPVQLNAAYELARCGQQGVAALAQALHDERLDVSRLAAYGLSVSGSEAAQVLRSALHDTRPETAAHAAFALGELGASVQPALKELAGLMSHPSEIVRLAVVEAFGLIGEASDEAVSSLIRAMQDPVAQVRFTAGLALAQVGQGAEAAVPYLAEAMEDENRYVRAHAHEALRYIGSEQAKDILIKALFNARWCPTTTPANTFYP
nr:HEAT repeat domain-containing protein [Paenibacillus phyllosphaerae]